MNQVIDIRELNERIERQSAFVDALVMGMNQTIVGQKHLVESLLIGLLSDGHILLEGVPSEIDTRQEIIHKIATWRRNSSEPLAMLTISEMQWLADFLSDKL